MIELQDNEKTSRSEYSPGVVTNNELLLRLGYAPEHFNEGVIVVSAISSADLSERGFSVDRETFAVKSIILSRAVRQMGNRPGNRAEAFLSRFRTGDVRKEFTADGGRAFIILDTAEPANRAHASILSAKKRSPSEIKELKLLLIPYLQHPVPVNDYFGIILGHFYAHSSSTDKS